MDGHFAGPGRDRGSVSPITPPIINVIPTISEDEQLSEFPFPLMEAGIDKAAAVTTAEFVPTSITTTTITTTTTTAAVIVSNPPKRPSLLSHPSSSSSPPEQAAPPFTLLAYPSDWAAFKQAYRDKCADLEIDQYMLCREQPLPPSERLSVMVPYSLTHKLDTTIEFSSLAEYEDQLAAQLADCTGGLESAVDKLEKMNFALLGMHNEAYREFFVFKKGMEELRAWLVESVSKPLRERCLVGIEEKRLKGLGHPRDWYDNLARLMEFWQEQVKFRREYLAHWCSLVEYGHVNTRIGLLRWAKKLVEIVREGRRYQVKEVMDLGVVFSNHLAGFGVLGVVFNETPDGTQAFLDDVMCKILLEEFDWKASMEEVCAPLEERLLWGKGEERVVFSLRGLSINAREEFGKMKADLNDLVRLERASGQPGAAIKGVHLIPVMDSVALPRHNVGTVVGANKHSKLCLLGRVLNEAADDEEDGTVVAKHHAGGMETEDEWTDGECAKRTADVKAYLVSEDDESEVDDMPKLKRQPEEKSQRKIKNRVKTWAQNLNPKRRLRALFGLSCGGGSLTTPF